MGINLRVFFLLTLTLALNNADGQAVFPSIKSVIDSIENKTKDSTLNHFLEQHDMASFTKDGEPITFAKYPHDTVSFSYKKIKIDTFKRNLFGTNKPEIIMQLRQENMYYINIFYKKLDKVFKVPGFISHLSNVYMGYHNEEFIFYFEKIAKPNIYSIITKEKYQYDRKITEEITIWDIQPDSIRDIYDVETFSHAWSGVGRYSYNTERKISFQSDSFPKQLVIKEKTVNYNNLEINKQGDTLSGEKIIRKGPTRVFFNYGDSGLKVKKVEDQIVEKTINIK